MSGVRRKTNQTGTIKYPQKNVRRLKVPPPELYAIRYKTKGTELASNEPVTAARTTPEYAGNALLR